jgi:chemotaxis protein methyltransferase CheR
MQACLVAEMKDVDCVAFLQDVLPRLGMRWPGFRKVRRQVCKRVERRRDELGLADVTAYRDYLDRHAAEWHVLDALCRITISRFYRDRRVFDLLKDEILPQRAAVAAVRDDHRVRVWSAGCASGEEVYTLKIIWQLAVQAQFPDVSLEIIATDADAGMLERSRRGEYQRGSLKDLPAEWLDAAFTQYGTTFCVNREFRNGIEFLLQDIRREQPPGPFDLILCRHLVFTYFDPPRQAVILDKIMARLFPDGILVTGKQETLPATACQLRLVEPHSGIYRLCRSDALPVGHAREPRDLG